MFPEGNITLSDTFAAGCIISPQNATKSSRHEGVVNKSLPSWKLSLAQHLSRYAATAASTRYYCTVISQRFGSTAVAYVVCSLIGLLSDSYCSCFII